MQKLKHRIIFTILTLMFFHSHTMGADKITLPSPTKTGGSPMVETLAKRHSERSFDSSKQLSTQQISNVLWAAVGVNRPDGKRTNPTARDSREITAYLFGQDGVFMYEPETNNLILVAEGDHRALLAGTKEFSQDFVLDAPIGILLVADLSKMPESPMNEMMAAVDAGIACQNINLYCQAVGLSTVPRATMDTEGIKQLLRLSDKCMPIINNPVGFAK